MNNLFIHHSLESSLAGHVTHRFKITLHIIVYVFFYFHVFCVFIYV